MAKELIYREDLIAEYDRVHIGEPGGARKLMVDAPAVDAVEVIHAEWRDGCGLYNGKITDHSIDCSHCQGIFKAKRKADVDQWKEQFVYCPFCGAKMDGGNEDA